MEIHEKTKEELIEELRIHQIELELQNHELRRIQNELESARDGYSDLYEFSPVGYVTISDNGLILKANLTAASLLGVGKSWLISRSFFKFIFSEDQDLFYLHRKKVLESSGKESCDIRLIKQDGSWFHARLESTAITGDQNQPGQMRIFLIDATESKRLETELQYRQKQLEELVQQRTAELSRTNQALQREVEERVRAQENLLVEKNFSDLTIDSLPGIFYVFDDSGKFSRWNQNLEKVSGYSEAEISQLHPLDLFSGEDKPAVAAAIARVLQDGTATVQADFVSRDGTKTPYFFTGRLVNLYGTRSLMGTGLDISDIRRAMEELRQYSRALERANAELDQFTYISSHHLQEPLRKLINFSELLAQRYKERLDERALRYLDYIVDGATRMRALIEDLLVYSRLDRFGPGLQKVNLHHTVRKVLSDLQASIQSSHAQVIFDNLPELVADPGEMELLLQNLISNAIKFHGEATPYVRISAKKGDCEWAISVRDNGLGIDSQFKDKVFDIFQRLHPAGAYPGTGIGLALCKKVVERHGGRIWFESQPGEGTVFCFTIPETRREGA